MEAIDCGFNVSNESPTWDYELLTAGHVRGERERESSNSTGDTKCRNIGGTSSYVFNVSLF